MKKFILVSALLLGVVGLSRSAGLVGSGAFATTMFSSGTVVTGGGAILAIHCSTIATAVNTGQYAQFFDTVAVTGAQAAAATQFAFTSVPANVLTPSLMLHNSTPTIANQIGNGYSWADFGGLHFNRALFFYKPVNEPGNPCTIIWKRNESNE